ncbi:hypothetical protein [Fusobacterium sp.]|uniref:hypothetical protein n=1 Tax=Fusobacterium sp. TaxID=68766 RepID=UPI0025B8C93C|nr:hypothetical protein [Fusobacterium sp.]MCI7223288.1 hypothetical protein [Fusobacterium sp.]
MIKKYIKKPTEVEAIQLTKDNIIEVFNFLDDTNYEKFKSPLELEEMECCIKKQGYVVISTLEGYMEVSFGDYIIKGIKSEFYPCKTVIFEATYQETNNFIDLNKLKDYECFIEDNDLMTQYGKVKEEINEFYLEFMYQPNGERIMSEGLDVITAMYNYLTMIGLSKKDFDKHIEKLERYKETKYKK